LFDIICSSMFTRFINLDTFFLFILAYSFFLFYPGKQQPDAQKRPRFAALPDSFFK